MSKFEKIKQKIKENKGKIILGCISIAGVIYVIVNQNGKIKMLSDKNKTLSDDVEILENNTLVLREVLTEKVLPNMKQSLKRQLGYAEGELNNVLLGDNAISEEYIKLRKEEIESIEKELLKIDDARRVLGK